MKIALPWHMWSSKVNKSTLQKDLLAGLTGSLIVLPQGIAYATIAGLPPEYGLYCAIAPVIIAALFGSSWHMVSGPTAAISIVVFSTLAPISNPGTGNYIQLSLALCLLVGLLQLSIGLAKLGKLSHFISHSVVVGFTTGAAFLIAASQLKHFFGLKNLVATDFIGQVSQTLALWQNININIAIVGSIALGVTLASSRINKSLPHMIIGMTAASISAIYLGNIPTIGTISASLPSITVPTLTYSTLSQLAPAALIISILGLTEAIAISRSLSLKSGQSIDSNQEVVGQGLSNIFGSFLSAYPSSGSFTRSGLNLASGAQTPLAAVFSSMFLMIIILLVTGLISHLPMTAMAGILFLVAWNLIDQDSIKELINGPKHELMVFSATFISTLLVKLEYAIFIGIVISLIFKKFGFKAEDESGHGYD